MALCLWSLQATSALASTLCRGSSGNARILHAARGRGVEHGFTRGTTSAARRAHRAAEVPPLAPTAAAGCAQPT